jgi:hypothetical protein
MFVATVIVSGILALAAAGSAAAKLTKQAKIIESFTRLGVPLSWLPRLAAAELAGTVGLLIGLKVAPLGIAAGIGLIAYFVGAVLTHVRANDKDVAPPLVLAFVSLAAVVLRIATM